MNSRIVSLSLIVTFSLLVLVVQASAQTRTVGVSMGDKFRYSLTVSWSSNDPSATFPSNLVDINNTQWAELTITVISGTTLAGQTVTHYKNGTETTGGGWVDVNTGNGENITNFVISTNLAANDSVYTSSQYDTWIINETVHRTYSNSVRNTNHLNMISLSGTESYLSDFYWDKSTGVLVELLQENINQTGAYTTTWSADMQIISSNVWSVPEFPIWTPALLMLIALTTATIVIARKRQPCAPA